MKLSTVESKYVDLGTPAVETARIYISRVKADGIVNTAKRINLFAQYLFEQKYPPRDFPSHPANQSYLAFEDLTKSQKLQLVAEHLGLVIDQGAQTYLSRQRQAEAGIAADLELDTDY